MLINDLVIRDFNVRLKVDQRKITNIITEKVEKVMEVKFIVSDITMSSQSSMLNCHLRFSLFQKHSSSLPVFFSHHLRTFLLSQIQKGKKKKKKLLSNKSFG